MLAVSFVTAGAHLVLVIGNDLNTLSAVSYFTL